MPAPTNAFKTALASGDLLLGCWAGFADPYATEVLATAGYDWFVIDGEHAPNDLRSISAQLAVLRGQHSHPVVRLPMGEAWLIKQVLDAGAQTLLIPMVESAAEARDLVRAMRYPPDGIRGSGAALARASHFADIPDYIATANDQMCLLVQVETRAGIDALDEILAVDGVDGVFIGPSDLAADMGHMGDASQADVAEVIEDALARIRAAGRAAGILALDDATIRRYRDWGANFLAVGIDVVMLAQTARQTLAKWRTDD
ncbi:MAG: 2-keto-3-deoxy-L-rhamnonate aldolase [Roseovarius sp.]|nr:2-keto-3-deoxy-L-rhamnonate aldolase [Roseovarius sp.]